MSKLYFPNPICEEYNQSWDSFGYPDSLCDLCKDQDKCEPMQASKRLWEYIGMHGWDENVVRLYQEQEIGEKMTLP